MIEEDIRPELIFKEYLRLAAKDSKIFFANSKKKDIPCPSCLKEGNHSFIKHNLSYKECSFCKTIFVSPRPSQNDLFKYYQYSDSAKYFATTFYDVTAKARRLKLWKPKAKMIQNILKKYKFLGKHLIDIGGGFGIFAEEYKSISDSKITIIEPGPELAIICRKKGFKVIESFLENVDDGYFKLEPKVFVSFELFEHLHDCNFFLKKLNKLMMPGDLFLFTTLSGLGIDIQTLWNKSNSISLQHLNFFNPHSIKILLQRNNFDIKEVSTPGKLDIDILFKNKDLVKDKFLKNLLLFSTDKSRDNLQRFVANNGLSSHMLVIAQKV